MPSPIITIIIPKMAQADFWVRLIMGKQKVESDFWCNDFVNTAMKEYRKWDVYKYIKKSYKDIIFAEKLMFKTFGSDKLLNRWWGVFMKMLQMMS